MIEEFKSKFNLIYIIGAPFATIGVITFTLTTVNENIIGSLFGIVIFFLQSFLIIQFSLSIKVAKDSFIFHNIITNNRNSIKIKDIINYRFREKKNEGITYLFNTSSGEIKIYLIKACYKNLDEFDKIIKLRINKVN